jgi:hypothetical protein
MGILSMNVWVYKASDSSMEKGNMVKFQGLKALVKFIDNLSIDSEKMVTITTLRDFIRVNIDSENTLNKAKELKLDKCELIIQIEDN